MYNYRKMRRSEQEISREECVEVLSSAPRGIMAFHGENGYPYAVPLNHYYDAGDGKLYFHGAKQGLKLDLMAKDNKVCFTVTDEGFIKEGDWALNIKSVVCLGRLDTVEDLERVRNRCRMIARKIYPDLEAAEEEVLKAGDRANVLVMTIDRMTGKLVNES